MKKVLIIEDESMLKEALREDLSEAGYEVITCSNADEAFEAMDKDKPDLILTDLVMHDVDGFEIIRLVKEKIHLSNIPILVLSNLGEKENVDRAMSMGAKDFIVKSDVSLSEIVKRVQAVLGDEAGE